jgi:hypothetical protein
MNLRPIKLSVICGALGVATMGCGPGDSAEQTTSSTSQTTATGTTTPSTTIDTTKLYGTAPDKVVPAPTFAVYNHESEVRTREDLMGHPTVFWFFPFADTPG